MDTHLFCGRCDKSLRGLCMRVPTPLYYLMRHQLTKPVCPEQASIINLVKLQHLKWRFSLTVNQRSCLPIRYFSLLRPFNELASHGIFSLCRLFSTFRSCMLAAKECWWYCAKCLFIALILAPFIGLDRLTAILVKIFLTVES